MPTVLRIAGYRFFFYSNEGSEPPHVHVERAGVTAKLWLRPVESASTSRFSPSEMNQVAQVVLAHRDRIEEAWHEHFNR